MAMRLDVQTMLAHPVRTAFLDALDARPGMTVGELARAWRVDYKTALHHARRLVAVGAVRAVADGRLQRLFPATMAPAPSLPAALPPPRQAVRALRAVRAGARGPAELARALNVPRGTAGSLLDGLARRGLVTRSDSGWRLLPEAERLLAPPARPLRTRPRRANT